MSGVGRAFLVSPRFCGPPHSGNGGYVAGRLASFVECSDRERAVEVTLRSPPPLGVRLEISDDDSGLLLRSEHALVAQAKPAVLTTDAPETVEFEVAVEAARRYAGRHDHPFPTCFVCGTDRADGDGLCLQPGSVGDSRVAAAWRPHESLGADGGELPPEFAWAALDCPGGWATDLAGRPMVLGRMTAHVLASPEVDRPCVVVGQLLGLDGRKAHTASALYAADGQLLARAEATWLEVDPASVRPADR